MTLLLNFNSWFFINWKNLFPNLKSHKTKKFIEKNHIKDYIKHNEKLLKLVVFLPNLNTLKETHRRVGINIQVKAYILYIHRCEAEKFRKLLLFHAQSSQGTEYFPHFSFIWLLDKNWSTRKVEGARVAGLKKECKELFFELLSLFKSCVCVRFGWLP